MLRVFEPQNCISFLKSLTFNVRTCKAPFLTKDGRTERWAFGAVLKPGTSDIYENKVRSNSSRSIFRSSIFSKQALAAPTNGGSFSSASKTLTEPKAGARSRAAKRPGIRTNGPIRRGSRRRKYLLRWSSGKKSTSAADIWDLMKWARGHRMAKSGIETACWDLEAKKLGVPLWRHLGGVNQEIECGVSIGIQDSIEQLLEKIRTELDAGYKRIKIKIAPRWDYDVIKAVREEFGDILLMGDANSAYTLADIDKLKSLDEFDLMMLEQPLALRRHRRPRQTAARRSKRRSASTSRSNPPTTPAKRSSSAPAR